MSWEPIETLIAISGYILASIGWLAFARERDRKINALCELAGERVRSANLGAQLTRLTDRDERGRFVKRERV